MNEYEQNSKEITKYEHEPMDELIERLVHTSHQELATEFLKLKDAAVYFKLLAEEYRRAFVHE